MTGFPSRPVKPNNVEGVIDYNIDGCPRDLASVTVKASGTIWSVGQSLKKSIYIH